MVHTFFRCVAKKIWEFNWLEYSFSFCCYYLKSRCCLCPVVTVYGGGEGYKSQRTYSSNFTSLPIPSADAATCGRF